MAGDQKQFDWYIVSLVIYSIGLVFSFVKLYLHTRNSMLADGTVGFYCKPSYRLMHHFFFICFMFCRVIFSALKMYDLGGRINGYDTHNASKGFYFLFSRSATFFLFISFSCAIIHLSYNLIPVIDKVKKVFFYVSLGLFVLPFIFLLPYTFKAWSDPNVAKEGDALYEMGIYFMLIYLLIMLFIISVFFIFVNIRLNMFTGDSLFYTVKKGPMIRLLVLVVIAFFCFAEQEFFFFYRPITNGKKIDNVLYLWVAYLMPELIIIGVLTVAMWKTRAKEDETAKQETGNMMIEFTA